MKKTLTYILMPIILFLSICLAGCATPDIVIRTTEYRADGGIKGQLGLGADGCQTAITGVLPTNVNYNYDGTKCDVVLNLPIVPTPNSE